MVKASIGNVKWYWPVLAAFFLGALAPSGWVWDSISRSWSVSANRRLDEYKKVQIDSIQNLRIIELDSAVISKNRNVNRRVDATVDFQRMQLETNDKILRVLENHGQTLKTICNEIKNLKPLVPYIGTWLGPVKIDTVRINDESHNANL